MKLSEKIRILRRARGMSQEEFGYSVSEITDGVSRQTVSDWENGKFEPKLDNIRDIAKVLNVSFDVLLDESIDLSDPKVLELALQNYSVAGESINTRVSYAIHQYSITKQKKIKFAISVAILALMVLSVVFVLCGLLFDSILRYFGYVLAFISLVGMPLSIINIIQFAKEYKNPLGHLVGHIDNSHITVHSGEEIANTISLPLSKIKTIEVDEKSSLRRGNVVISFSENEKPITLLDISFPHKLVEVYHKIIAYNDDGNSIKIL